MLIKSSVILGGYQTSLLFGTLGMEKIEKYKEKIYAKYTITC